MVNVTVYHLVYNHKSIAENHSNLPPDFPINAKSKKALEIPLLTRDSEGFSVELVTRFELVTSSLPRISAKRANPYKSKRFIKSVFYLFTTARIGRQ